MTDPRILLKRDESYAVHALVNIAEHPGTTAAHIAAALELPPAYTAKVLGKLARAGFTESQMGRAGGVRLRRGLEDVSVLDVVEAISGPLLMDTCQTRARCATQVRKGHCRVKLAWFALTASVREALASVTLAQLCDAPAHPNHEKTPP
jgi:Rrf2 family protein